MPKAVSKNNRCFQIFPLHDSSSYDCVCLQVSASRTTALLYQGPHRRTWKWVTWYLLSVAPRCALQSAGPLAGADTHLSTMHSPLELPPNASGLQRGGNRAWTHTYQHPWILDTEGWAFTLSWSVIGVMFEMCESEAWGVMCDKANCVFIHFSFKFLVAGYLLLYLTV